MHISTDLREHRYARTSSEVRSQTTRVGPRAICSGGYHPLRWPRADGDFMRPRYQPRLAAVILSAINRIIHRPIRPASETGACQARGYFTPGGLWACRQVFLGPGHHHRGPTRRRGPLWGNCRPTTSRPKARTVTPTDDQSRQRLLADGRHAGAPFAAATVPTQSG